VEIASFKIYILVLGFAIHLTFELRHFMPGFPSSIPLLRVKSKPGPLDPDIKSIILSEPGSFHRPFTGLKSEMMSFFLSAAPTLTAWPSLS